MRKLSLIVFTVGCVLGTSAKAEEGLELGVKLGYAIPFGDIDSGTKLSDATSGAVPVDLDVGLRLGRGFRASAYGSYAYAIAGDLFDRYDSAHGSRWGAGLELEWRPSGRAGLAPWASLAAGWEWLNMTGELAASGSRLKVETSSHGPRGALSGGVLWPVSDDLSAGPFLTIGRGRYESTSGTINGEPMPELQGQETRSLGWVELGVRGTFGR